MPPTPVRSALKKGFNQRDLGQRKMNVSFTSNPISRTPSAIVSALYRSFNPVSYRPDTPNTIRTLKLNSDNDPNDKSYTSTDEEADEFKDEPYEYESEPGLEDEDDNYSVQNPEDEYDEGFEDSYLLEMEEKLGQKISAFSPLRQINRTPVPINNSASGWGAVHQSGPVTILRRNIQQKMENLERQPDPQKYMLPPKRNPNKSKLKVGKDGSPHLDITPDIQLRKEMEGNTPDQSRSGKASNPRSFGRARRNLYGEHWGSSRKTPSGDPPPLPDADHQDSAPEVDLKNTQFAIYNMVFALFIFLGIVAFTNRAEGIQAIANFPKTVSHVFSHPGRIVPGIAGAVIAVPEYIICSVISCESTSNHLKTISVIAADTTLDLTTLKDFSDLITALGKPLILNVSGDELASKVREEIEESRDRAEIQAIDNLAQAYQEAHKDLRAMVTGSQTLIKMTSKKWFDFSGFLTEQIPKEVRAEIDLPDGWTLFTTGTRTKYSAKALKSRYRTTRENMAVSYQWFYTATEVSENSVNAVLEQTQAIHKAGVYESEGILKVLGPLAESVSEIRRHIAFQAKFFGSNDNILGENNDEDFTFRSLKWKVESLWASVTMLQDSMIGRAYGRTYARTM